MPTDAQNHRFTSVGIPKQECPLTHGTLGSMLWGLPTAESRTGFLMLRPLVGDRIKT